jgi:DNA-binding transcriptional ArsR family regulator
MLNDQAVGRVFHALGEPTRRAIIERLSAGPVSVSDLAHPLDMTLAAVIQHLQVLEDSGLVQSEKVGRIRTCRLNVGGLKLVERWVSERRSLWERRLDQLGELLEKDDPPKRPVSTEAKKRRPP